MSRLHIAILCLAASRFGGLPQRAEAAARGVNEGLPLAGDTGMLQGRFQGLRCRDASAKMPFVLPIRLYVHAKLFGRVFSLPRNGPKAMSSNAPRPLQVYARARFSKTLPS